jgi:DNA-binding transcriptional regulator YhcF (GntR family)
MEGHMIKQVTSSQPKSQQVADALRREIHVKALAPGERLHSIRQLANHFQVSNKVVVRAFDILEDEELIQREAGRGTFVKKNTNNTPLTFGLLTQFHPHDFNDYFEAFQSNLEGRNAFGIPLPFGNGRDWRTPLKRFIDSKPAGLFIDTGPWADPNEFKELARDTHICFIHRWQWPEEPKYPTIAIDFKQMRIDGIKYLMNKGHKTIGIVGPHGAPHREYGRDLEKAANALGLEFPSAHLPYLCRHNIKNNPYEIRKIFSSDERPTALISLNDHLIATFNDELRQFMPELPPLELLGAYDTDWSKRPGEEFNSFHIDYNALWQQAFDTLNEPLNNPPTIRWIRPRLVEQ